ncbi:54S ribosomal protein L3 mitochondrial [Teratosphaeriaceae sp. CCFEE 6253]|nr:54S ribosomal protein L3 mitochondrial [Teratosphaeriaceae sp. CCFEE 6253]
MAAILKCNDLCSLAVMFEELLRSRLGSGDDHTDAFALEFTYLLLLVPMKRISRPDRWASLLHPPRNPRLHQQRCAYSHETTTPRRDISQRTRPTQSQWQPQRRHISSKRKASTAAAAQEIPDGDSETPEALPLLRHALYAPSHRRAIHSAKLAALHARLSLPAKLPLQSLARCLIDPSADPRPGHNNSPFAVLGQDLLGLHTTEHLVCHYPRVPMSVLFAAQYAYVGAATLSAVRQEWGVEIVAAPGQEVDPGLLQFRRQIPGNALAPGEAGVQVKDMPSSSKLGTGRKIGGRNGAEWNYRRGISSRVVFDDEFGDVRSGLEQPYPGAQTSTASADGASGLNADENTTPGSSLSTLGPADTEAVTLEQASASFVRALTGALFLHAGRPATLAFHKDHILSRHFDLHTMFNFTHPTRDLSRLCARENYEPPVARLISETGRLSRTPVFVVGVYSGENLLGEAAGASLNEARVRAAAAALKGWYLYSPPKDQVVPPSSVDGAGAGKGWKAQMIDSGEIVT